ncbi:hypothetical protein HBI58_212680 [Parastagonospora nodorum]|nr:hypothetical protein HBI58_212680 [Parastagonospora nodorum]
MSSCSRCSSLATKSRSASFQVPKTGNARTSPDSYKSMPNIFTNRPEHHRASFCTMKSTAAPAAPYRYFGTENGQDCRCGNSYKHSRATKTCRTACKGNNKQACGGTNAINVWVNQDFVAGGTSTKKPSVNSYPTQGAGENRPPMWVGDGVDEPYFPDDSKYWEGQEPAPADKPKPTSGTKPRPGNAGYPANSKPSPKPASGYKATKPSGYPATPAKRWLSRFNLW